MYHLLGDRVALLSRHASLAIGRGDETRREIIVYGVGSEQPSGVM
jgi:hypothetical protein